MLDEKTNKKLPLQNGQANAEMKEVHPERRIRIQRKGGGLLIGVITLELVLEVRKIKSKKYQMEKKKVYLTNGASITGYQHAEE